MIKLSLLYHTGTSSADLSSLVMCVVMQQAFFIAIRVHVDSAALYKLHETHIEKTLYIEAMTIDEINLCSSEKLYTPALHRAQIGVILLELFDAIENGLGCSGYELLKRFVRESRCPHHSSSTQYNQALLNI